MRMVSLLVLAIGVVLIIVAIRDNLSSVITEIGAIGQGTALTPGTPGAPPGNCIDSKTGKSVPCVNSTSLSQAQQNLVTL
jgi:hypothetical protein